MPMGIGIISSLCAVLIIVGVLLKIYADTGRMLLLEQLEEDWRYRLPFHLRHNKYRGVNRPFFQFWAILYYTVKAAFILTLCAYYYITVGVFIAVKWCWGTIQSAHNAKATGKKQEVLSESPAKNTVRNQSKQQTVTRHAAAVSSSGNTISSLWNYGSEIAWHEALDYYYESLKAGEQALECCMENIDAAEIARLSAAEFYEFLHSKYFVWKYTAKNRLATTRRSLERYADENKLSELADTQKRLFSADRSDIEKCLSIAAEIRGLGPAGASGLLSVLFPEDFGTIDQYVVKALREIEGFPYSAELEKMNPDSLSIKDGILLIQILREQAVKLNEKFDTDFWTPRRIDMVLWSIGRVRR